MILLDFIIEIAPRFDFWVFKDGIVPITNYFGWFLVASIFIGGINPSRLIQTQKYLVTLSLAYFYFSPFLYLCKMKCLII